MNHNVHYYLSSKPHGYNLRDVPFVISPETLRHILLAFNGLNY